MKLVVLIVTLVGFVVGCGRVLEDTNYASGYSEEKFRSIKKGMTVISVVGLLGKPLDVTTQNWSEVWIYCSSDIRRGNDGAQYLNMFGPVTYLHMTLDGEVEKQAGDYLSKHFVGMNKDSVRREIGNPNRTEEREYGIIYKYTSPGKWGNGSYNRRDVYFDADGKVSKVISIYHAD